MVGPKILELEAVNCGICGDSESRHYTSGRDYEYHTTENDFQVVECAVCHNLYLNPRPHVDDLPIIYPPNYYAYNYDTAINPLAIKAKDWLDSLKIKQWLKYVPTKTPRFLDIGCGNGRYLRMLHQQLGVPKQDLYGIEMSQDPIDQLNRDGFQGYYGRIEDVADRLPAGSFDLIVLLQVLEHVENPNAMMQTLAGLLSPGGVLIIETPNTDSWDMHLFRKKYWGGYHFPRHWNLMNRECLTYLARQHNLQVNAFNFLPSQSFWIYSFHHWVENELKLPGLARFFNPFQNLILLALFTSFDIFRAKLGFQTSNIQLVAVKS